MKLLIDIGNTATKFALFKEGKLFKCLRNYNQKVSEKEIQEFLIGSTIDRVYISSVAPKIAENIEGIIYKLTNKKPSYINNSFNNFININIDNKEELGIDLLCDLVAAKEKYGTSLAIVDFGTATKILFIDKNGIFSSCAIFLGFEKSKSILSSSTELLPEVKENKIKMISESHNTIDVINTSAYYSQLFTVNGIIDKFEKEVGYSLKRIITGGNAAFFIKDMKEYIHDEHLLFDGLNILSEGK